MYEGYHYDGLLILFNEWIMRRNGIVKEGRGKRL